MLPSVITADSPAGDPLPAPETIVPDVERDAVQNRVPLRSLLENDREAFYGNAIDLLKGFHNSTASGNSTGREELIGLLVASGLLLRLLCDPKLAKPEAMALARAAALTDPLVDAVLAKGLADSAGPNGGPVPTEAAPRLMEILAGISDGKRIVPWIMRLMRHPNPNIRSKAVLMIGRSSHSIQWLKGRMAQSDPRIRANAIEAMWSVDSRDAQILLRFALADLNNRVVGNALLGLYQVGDCSVIPEIAKMARHEATLFRSTAAWVMGETGDPRFTETLIRMLVKPDFTVRKRAFTAIGCIKAAVAQIGQGTEWRVSGVIEANEPIGRQSLSRRTVRLAVAASNAASNGGGQPKILPTQFILTEGTRNVLSYKVTEMPAAGAMSVIFIFPRTEEPASAPWNLAASQCLAWKRQSDYWCNLPFLPAGDPDVIPGNPGAPAASVNHAPPALIQSPEALAESFSQTPGVKDCSELWATLWRCVVPHHAAVPGKRHLIVVAPAPIAKAAGRSLISNVISSRTSLQVISSVSNPKVAEFCSQAKGRLQTFENPAEIPELIQQAYLNLLVRYEISYVPVSPEATILKARVHTPSGWGEVRLPIPRA